MTQVSVYRFAKENGMRPQQLYQMVQNGSFPETLLTYEQVGDRTQPMVKVEEAQQWLQDRKRAPHLGRQELANAVVEMIDDPRLAARVKKYFQEHQG